MTLEDFNKFCASLPAASHIVQWRGTHVWKIGGKIFALAPLCEDGAFQSVCFKVSVR